LPVTALHFPFWTLSEALVEPLAVGIGEENGIRIPDHRREPDVFRVIGDHEEIERPDKLHRLPGVGDDLFAAREAIGIVHVQRGADEARIR
jgi:hypothetical protein